VFTSVLHSVMVVLLLGCPFFLFEWRFRARRVAYWKALPRDLGAYLVGALASVGAAAVLGFLVTQFHVFEVLRLVPPIPLWASIPLVVVGIDFGLYWMHRLIHTSALWRLHRWHHVPRQMYWLAGMRTSMLQQVLYGTLPLSLVAFNMPPMFVAVYGLFATVTNHWMHANLRFRSRWLEAFLVTPRIHHVHHSMDPRHRGRNFGSIFCVWDRMFGTFFDPDDVEAPLEFGIPDVVAAPRIVIGL
jgi:sterol desaturase/sphingolipid hydroxylase (fatty acid hydroxylase superfamily)